MDNSDKHTLEKSEQSNRVFKILALLEEKYQKRLLKYLRSPYFIQSKTLFQFCQAYFQLSSKAREVFRREKLWEIAFPEEPFDDVLFRKYCSDLLKHVQVFMAHEALTDNPLKLAMEKIDFIADHKIEILYKNIAQEFRALQEAQPFKSAQHFMYGYRFERQFFTMMEYDVKVDQRANLEEISTNLDALYWSEKLRFAGAAISQQKTGSVPYHFEMVEEIVGILKKLPIENTPRLAIEYYSFMTLHDAENVEHYFNLKRFLKEFSEQIPQETALEIIDSALHYCTGKINKGHQEFNQEYFDLFDEGLKKGIFISKGELATWRFNNMVAAATKLGKLAWAESFIEKYHHFLPAESRSNTYTFNLARVYRIQGKYHDVLSLLQNVEYEDTGYNLISKAMQLISYFELNEFEALSSHQTAFQTYLNRHKDISKPRRLSYSNLIKYSRKLLKIKPHDSVARARLKDEIIANKANTVNLEWLLDKLA